MVLLIVWGSHFFHSLESVTVALCCAGEIRISAIDVSEQCVFSNVMFQCPSLSSSWTCFMYWCSHLGYEMVEVV